MCGKEKVVESWGLKSPPDKSGRSTGTKSCGCLLKEKSSLNGKLGSGKVTIKNYLIGKKFGRLIVIKDTGKRTRRLS